MNYIILVLEFIVLVTSIGLFIAKKEAGDDGSWNINWTIALLIATILMIGMNISTVCYGMKCFFTCGGGDEPGADDAKKAVAIYRNVKQGKKAELGTFSGYKNVDLKHINNDLEEENLFLGAETPEEIQTLAKNATKAILAQRLKERQTTTAKLVGDKTQELQRNLANRPLLPTPGPIPERAKPQGGGFLGVVKDVIKQTEVKPDPKFLARQAAAKAALAVPKRIDPNQLNNHEENKYGAELDALENENQY